MFDIVTEVLQSADNRYNVASIKIDAYCEAALSQYEINCKKAELKVLKESGTIEDYWYLEEAAGKNLVESLKTVIKAIIDKFKKFVNELKLKILSTITSDASKKKVNTIEKKVKFNPILAKKKINVKDRKKIDAVFAWIKAEIRKLLAMIKSGKEIDKDKISELKELFRKKLAAAAVVGSSITIAAGNALSSVNKRISSIGQRITKIDKETTDDISDIENVGGEHHKDSFTDLEQLASLRSDVGKEEVSDAVDSVTGDLQIISKAVTKEKEESNDDENEKSVEESMLDDMTPSLSDYFGESETDQMLKDMETELFEESSDDNQDDDYLNDDGFDFDF